jgi:hypothetical protein
MDPNNTKLHLFSSDHFSVGLQHVVDMVLYQYDCFYHTWSIHLEVVARGYQETRLNSHYFIYDPIIITAYEILE